MDAVNVLFTLVLLAYGWMERTMIADEVRRGWRWGVGLGLDISCVGKWTIRQPPHKTKMQFTLIYEEEDEDDPFVSFLTIRFEVFASDTSNENEWKCLNCDTIYADDCCTNGIREKANRHLTQCWGLFSTTCIIIVAIIITSNDGSLREMNGDCDCAACVCVCRVHEHRTHLNVCAMRTSTSQHGTYREWLAVEWIATSSNFSNSVWWRNSATKLSHGFIYAITRQHRDCLTHALCAP